LLKKHLQFTVYCGIILLGCERLMTERFGTRMDRPGDVFWDLFRTGNVNREDGNKETIWALQYEFGSWSIFGTPP